MAFPQRTGSLKYWSFDSERSAVKSAPAISNEGRPFTQAERDRATSVVSCIGQISALQCIRMATSNIHYWQYFVALEEDLAKTSRFVEVDEANMDTFSLEFARLILSVGSEIDILAKVICAQHGLPIPLKNINGYRKAITGRFPGFVKLQVNISRFGLELEPWRCWHDGKNPDWWKAYTDVKHERHLKFKRATLRNTIECIAGLFVMVCYVCHAELRANEAMPWPQLLSLDPTLNSRIRNDLRPGFVLPDFRS